MKRIKAPTEVESRVFESLQQENSDDFGKYFGRAFHNHLFDRNFEYDINFMIPFHTEGGYRDRLSRFKELGILNHSNKRIHVTGIFGPQVDSIEIEGFLSWTQPFSITLLQAVDSDPVSKINGAYLWMAFSKLRARWHFRVDDDSITDAVRSFEVFERDFSNTEIHLLTSPLVSPENVNKFMPHIPSHLRAFTSFSQEWESSVTSSKAMCKILGNEIALNFFRSCIGRIREPGDVALTFAARIADVPVGVNSHFTKEFVPSELSAVSGGQYTHIHFVPWTDLKFVARLRAALFGVIEPLDERIRCLLDGQRYRFGRWPGPELFTMEFCQDGSVLGGTHDNERFWRFDDGLLRIQNGGEEETTVFNKLICSGGRSWIIGRYLLEDIYHFIEIL